MIYICYLRKNLFLWDLDQLRKILCLIFNPFTEVIYITILRVFLLEIMDHNGNSKSFDIYIFGIKVISRTLVHSKVIGCSCRICNKSIHNLQSYEKNVNFLMISVFFPFSVYTNMLTGHINYDQQCFLLMLWKGNI